MVVLATPIFPKRLTFLFLGHESSGLLERYPNRVAFGKGPKPVPDRECAVALRISYAIRPLWRRDLGENVRAHLLDVP
jgi:hypothetical protein